MSDLNAAPAADAAPGPIDYQPPALSQDEISLDDAVRLWNEPPKKKTEAESADEPATAEPESPAQAEDADQLDADPGETQTQADDPAEELPPIEPPRSWTKEEKEAFAKWPREAQESTARVASAREAEFRRSQNEIAEARNAVKAERDAAEKARQQYESKLPSLLNELESVNQAQFGDIKSMEDVVKLQAEDPFRFQSWQVHQMRLQAAKVESDRVSAEKATAEQSNWMKHVQEENAKAAEFIAELADKDKAEKLTSRVAKELLPELGFKDSELADLANGKAKLSIYDHRVQRLLADALKLRDIQSAPKAVATKPLPPVQRPGTRAPAGAAAAQDLKTLNQKLNVTGSVDDAMALLMAQRKAS
jgi:hypothetical protein